MWYRYSKYWKCWSTSFIPVCSIDINYKYLLIDYLWFIHRCFSHSCRFIQDLTVFSKYQYQFPEDCHYYAGRAWLHVCFIVSFFVQSYRFHIIILIIVFQNVNCQCNVQYSSFRLIFAYSNAFNSLSMIKTCLIRLHSFIFLIFYKTFSLLLILTVLCYSCFQYSIESTNLFLC